MNIYWTGIKNISDAKRKKKTENGVERYLPLCISFFHIFFPEKKITPFDSGQNIRYSPISKYQWCNKLIEWHRGPSSGASDIAAVNNGWYRIKECVRNNIVMKLYAALQHQCWQRCQVLGSCRRKWSRIIASVTVIASESSTSFPCIYVCSNPIIQPHSSASISFNFQIFPRQLGMTIGKIRMNWKRCSGQQQKIKVFFRSVSFCSHMLLNGMRIYV